MTLFDGSIDFDFFVYSLDAGFGPLFSTRIDLDPLSIALPFYDYTGQFAFDNRIQLSQLRPAVPAPAMIGLLGIGAAAIGLRRRNAAR